jgi:hypothetical protein
MKIDISIPIQVRVNRPICILINNERINIKIKYNIKNNFQI